MNVRHLLGAAALVLSSLSLVAEAQTAAPYAWDAPTKWDNGTQLTPDQIAAYDITCRFKPLGGGSDLPCTLSKTSFAGGSAVSDTLNATIPISGGDLCLTLVTRTTVALGAKLSIGSNETCRTYPGARPNPPTNFRSVAINVQIRLDSHDGFDRTVAFQLDSLGRRSGTLCGFVKIGTPCTGEKLFTYRGQDYYRFLAAHPRTGAPNMAGWDTPSTENCAAPCGA